VSDLDTLGEELARSDPRLLTCNCHGPASSGGVDARIEIFLVHSGPARICIGGHYSEQHNPTPETISAVIDEVELLIQTQEGFRRY
jgi:hypothetical protein